MTHPGAFPSYELSTYKALPIPDYLAPPGVKITHDNQGGHINFESKFDPTSTFTKAYLNSVGRFLLSSHIDQLNNRPKELSRLSELYSANISVTLLTLQALYQQQAGLIKNGSWDDAENINHPDRPFSIPREISNLSLKSFLLRHLKTELSKPNPLYRRMSSTESNSALDVYSPGPDQIQVDIVNKETFVMMQSNALLEEQMERALADFSEKELVAIFLLSPEERRDRSITLVPSIFDEPNKNIK